jgi:hypothetical protein
LITFSVPTFFAANGNHTLALETGPFFSLRFNTMLGYHHTSLNLFESFERYQDQLDANNLLKLARVEPRYTVNAYKGSNHIWEDWAYDNDELQSLKNAATEAGFTYTVEPVK